MQKNIRLLINGNSKIICLHDTLRARTFRACRESLRAGCVHAFEHAGNFLRSVFAHLMFFPIFTLAKTFVVIPLLIWVTSSTIKFAFTLFDSFILLILLKTFRFKSSVFSGTYTLLDRSLRVF